MPHGGTGTDTDTDAGHVTWIRTWAIAGLGLGFGIKLHVRCSVYTLSIRSGLINYESAAH